MWLAEPPARRLPLNEEEFMRAFQTNAVELAGIRGEPGFWQAVVKEAAPWMERVADVKAAILKNALDPGRPDQWTWMQRYEEMLGLDFLPESGG